MCAVCAFISIPACSIDGSCSSAVVENLKMIALASTPAIGGTSVWLRTKLTKKKKKKTE